MVRDSRQWDAMYGWDLISQHAEYFKDSIFLSSPSAMAAVEPHLVFPPTHVEFQKGMKELDKENKMRNRFMYFFLILFMILFVCQFFNII